MADRVIMLPATDSNGDPVPGAQAFFYDAGTLDPVVVYADQLATVALGTSVAANAAGVFPAVFTQSILRLDVRDADDTSLPGYPSDFWYVVPANGLGASTITFEPVEGNPATNVAGAIGNLTNLWNAVTTFGRALINTATAAAARDELGLGDLATQDILNETDLATSSETRPQSSTAVKTYVDDNIAALPFVNSYTSGNLGYSAGGLVTVSHGLGQLPNYFDVFVVCVTADGDFAVGTFAKCPGISFDGRGVSPRATTTQIIVRIGSDGITLLNNTGSFYRINTANWRLVIRAWA